MFQYSFALATVVAPGFFSVLFTAGRPLPFVALSLLALVGAGAMLLLERRHFAERGNRIVTSE